jgi:hypothetical protein
MPGCGRSVEGAGKSTDGRVRVIVIVIGHEDNDNALPRKAAPQLVHQTRSWRPPHRP